MKTLVKTTSLLIALTVLLSANLNASAFNFVEESYIDDIPFDTGYITANCIYQKAVSVDFQFEEEEYIDDIPFDTEYVTTDCLYKKAVSVDFQLEEEEYIDDMGL